MALSPDNLMALLPDVVCLGNVQGPPSTDLESSMSQVKTKEAFQSPDLLQNCIGFLRQYAGEKSARAACAVVPIKDIAFPQVNHIPQTPYTRPVDGPYHPDPDALPRDSQGHEKVH
jgi:hypothetical protein